MFIAKYDADGNFQWAQQANGNAGSEGVGIGVDAQGNSYITGFFEGTFEIGSSTFVSTGLSDIFLVKYDTDGNFQWAIQDGGSDFDVGHGIAVDDLGNSSVTGYFGGTAAIGDSTFVSAEDSREIYISKYDIDGNFIWAKQDGGDGDDEAFGIAVDDQGNNYVTGYFTETAAIGDSTFMSFGDYDIFIAKYNCPIVAAPIPTLSQWGMMVLILCFMTIGIVFLRERKKGVA